ncbi:hypothetical protein M5K25_026153 [Dendrobium thyrsiflorum]|uniref:Uncharacterized protein n=1 Tax=Dendrobium thyrsiflorum TaxID=117978 RepID=A0ABD0TWL5_DENTH
MIKVTLDWVQAPGKKCELRLAAAKADRRPRSGEGEEPELAACDLSSNGKKKSPETEELELANVRESRPNQRRKSEMAAGVGGWAKKISSRTGDSTIPRLQVPAQDGEKS